MRALALCCLALSAFLSPALAENCDAEHYAAAQRIQSAQAKLDHELGPYEAAPWTVGPWEDLMAAISQERRRLSAIPCSLTGIPDAAKLPPGWDTVRDIGAWQVIEVDRNLTILSHPASVARKPTPTVRLVVSNMHRPVREEFDEWGVEFTIFYGRLRGRIVVPIQNGAFEGGNIIKIARDQLRIFSSDFADAMIDSALTADQIAQLRKGYQPDALKR